MVEMTIQMVLANLLTHATEYITPTDLHNFKRLMGHRFPESALNIEVDDINLRIELASNSGLINSWQEDGSIVRAAGTGNYFEQGFVDRYINNSLPDDVKVIVADVCKECLGSSRVGRRNHWLENNTWVKFCTFCGHWVHVRVPDKIREDKRADYVGPLDVVCSWRYCTSRNQKMQMILHHPVRGTLFAPGDTWALTCKVKK